jgi:hypothetical protein
MRPVNLQSKAFMLWMLFRSIRLLLKTSTDLLESFIATSLRNSERQLNGVVKVNQLANVYQSVSSQSFDCLREALTRILKSLTSVLFRLNL